MSNVITVGGVSSADYGIIVLDVNDTDMPGRDYSVVSIPGRSRDLHYDNGRYNNIDRVYTCFVKDSDSFGKTRDTIAAFVGRIMRLKGYQRIECGLHPDIYMKGEFRGEMQPNFAKTKDAAVFKLTFDCDGRKYLISGEQEITLTTGTQTVTNPGTQDAFPLFVLMGDGTVNFGNDFSFTVTDNPGTLVLDCEIGDAYSQLAHTNYNQYVSFSNYQIPRLVTGNNTIQVTGFTSCVMTPRWCNL